MKDLLPDASKSPPASKVTPAMLAAAERRVKDMRAAGADPHDIAEAARAHQEMLEAQTKELQRIALAREIADMTRGKR